MRLVEYHPDVHAHRGDTQRDGRCNSCLDPQRPVLVVRIGMQAMRLCDRCAKELSELMKQAAKK